jgi:hypothetical protein
MELASQQPVQLEGLHLALHPTREAITAMAATTATEFRERSMVGDSWSCRSRPESGSGE